MPLKMMNGSMNTTKRIDMVCEEGKNDGKSISTISARPKSRLNKGAAQIRKNEGTIVQSVARPT